MSEQLNCGCINYRLTGLITDCGEIVSLDNPLIVKSDLSDGWALIDEVTDDLIYMGFPATINDENPDETDPLCSILKVEKIGTVTTRKWAGGTMTKDKQWSDRLILEYHFLS